MYFMAISVCQLLLAYKTIIVLFLTNIKRHFTFDLTSSVHKHKPKYNTNTFSLPLNP